MRTFLLNLLAALIAVGIAFSVYWYFGQRGDRDISNAGSAYVVSVEDAQTLFTGRASVGLAWIYGKVTKVLPPEPGKSELQRTTSKTKVLRPARPENFWISGPDKKSLPPTAKPDDEMILREDFTGACYKQYDVTVGYPKLGVAVEQFRAWRDAAKEAPQVSELRPRLLTTNTRRILSGGDVPMVQCDRFAEDSIDVKLALIKEQMEEDKQWDIHVRQACLVLASYARISVAKDRRNPKTDGNGSEDDQKVSLGGEAEQVDEVEVQEDEALCDRWIVAQDKPSSVGDPGVDLSELTPQTYKSADWDRMSVRALDQTRGTRNRVSKTTSYGAIGSTVLTVSSVSLFGQKHSMWKVWLDSGIYLRRDVAQVFYGTAPYGMVVEQRRSADKVPTLIVELSAPRRLAVDRQLVFAASNGDFVRSKEQEGDVFDVAVITQIEDVVAGHESIMLEAARDSAVRALDRFAANNGKANLEVRWRN